MNIRRNPRRRMLVGGVAVAAATALTVPAVSAFAEDHDGSAEAAAEYEVTELPAPDGFDGASVRSVSPSGEYLVGHGSNGNLSTPLLWHDGEVEQIDVPDAASAGPLAVTSSGKVMGTFSYDSGDGGHIFFYEDGEVEIWEDDPDFTPSGLNDEGTMSGSYVDDNGDMHPAVWPEDADAPELLEMPTGWIGGTAWGVNEDGVVAGQFSAGGESTSHPAMWDADGVLTELQLPDELADLDEEVSMLVDAVSGDWIVAHVDQNTPDVYGAVLWNVADGDAPGELLPSAGMWRDVSSDGWTVGLADNGPAVLADGEVVDLPGILDEHSIHDIASGISADGQVIGGDLRDEDERSIPIAWTLSG